MEANKRLKEIKEYLCKHATKAVNAHVVGMIAIDNKSRKDDGTVPDLDVEKLRFKIQEYAMEYFFLGKVPVKWIRLELSMRQLQKEKINLEEAKVIGKKLEMTEEDIDIALEFYHSVGEILHFTSIPELKNIIILDVVWLVNLFKILISQAITYKEDLEDVPTKVWNMIDELHHEGRLHEELLDYLLKRHDRQQDKAILLATTEMYDILFRMPDSDGDKPVYYLPSLLKKDAKGKNGIVCPADSKSSAPIYFHFHGNFLPEGLFYRLIVRCLKKWPHRKMVLRKNKARIYIVNDDFHITLCKEDSDIQLKALIMSESKDAVKFHPRLLSNVRYIVESELNDLIMAYTPNMKYQVCIKCQCPNHHPGELLSGSEDTDDRCVAVEEQNGKIKAICDISAKQVAYPDLKLWYSEEKTTEGNTHAINASSTSSISERETLSSSDGIVLTIGHEWATHKGGISTIHRLTSSLAAGTGRKVHATVLEANKEEKKDAALREVHLMLPVNDEDSDSKPSVDWLAKYHSHHYPSLEKMSDVKVVIGHLPVTSKAALNIQRKYYQSKKIILFNHVLPEDTEVRKDEFTPTRVKQKESILIKEANASHVIFSVGPRVYHYFENKFRMLTSAVKHELFLPMPDETYFQLGITKPSIDCQSQILTYGRIDHVAHLQGYDVVAPGLSQYVTNLNKWKPASNPPIWQISGVQEELVQSARDFIKEYVTSGDLVCTVTHDWSKDQIKVDLQESHLCVFPSRVEPHGIVGLEAIAAGVPVLVNSHSGLAKFLTKYMDPDKAAAVIVDVGVTDQERDSDIRKWAERITAVFNGYDYAFQRAQDMKEMLRNCSAITDTHELFKKECLCE